MLKYICNYFLNCQIKLGFYNRCNDPISCLKNLSCLLAGVFITQSAINVSAEEFSPAEREFQNKQRQQSQEMQNLEILKQLPAQDLSTGTLIIRMLWGKLSGFLINGQPPQGWYEHAMLVGAMPGIEGSIFNIHISDQIVENLNTAGKSVHVEVVPAQEQGYSYLNLKVVRRLPVSGSLSIDNSGSERADGNTRASAQVTISDVLGVNDSLNLNTSKRFFNRRTDDNAEHVNGGSWNVPIGYWSLGASYSNIQSQQLLQTVHGGDYHNASSIKDAKLKLNRVLTRDQSGKTNAWFEISNRNNATYFV